MLKEKDTEIMSRYDDYSIDELKEALKTVFLFSELSAADVEELNQIMAALREKAPFPHPHTAEEMWAEFKADNAEALANIGIRKIEDAEEVVYKKTVVDPDVRQTIPEITAVRPKRHRRLFRIGLIAAIMVVIIVAAALTASALGYDLFKWIPKWSKEDVRFVSEATEQPYQESIPSVLNELGITELLYPNWIPEDLVLTDSVYDKDRFLFFEAYRSDDRFLSITISATTGSETAVYQKEDTSHEEYVTSNVTHYIFDNTNEVSAVWYSDNYTTLIVGNITLEEMIRIIDSVYEVKK